MPKLRDALERDSAGARFGRLIGVSPWDAFRLLVFVFVTYAILQAITVVLVGPGAWDMGGEIAARFGFDTSGRQAGYEQGYGEGYRYGYEQGFDDGAEQSAQDIP